MDVKNKFFDKATGHYKCQACGFWSTHPMDNHKCFKMPLPKRIIRLDDGMEFVLNENTQKYSIHTGIPRIDSVPTWEYEFELLMCDPRHKGVFKIADGTEDIIAMKNDWKRRMDLLSKNDGHGDEDDGC